METVLRVGLGIVLAGAALAKLARPHESIAALATFGFEGGPVRHLAWGSLIALELGLASAVALGSDFAAYAAAALMLLFAAITAGAVLRGRSGSPCLCFGPRSKISWLGVLRNLALAAAFAATPSLGSVELGTEGWLGVGIGVALLACAGLGVAVLALAREVGMLRLQLGTQGALEIAGEGPEIGSREVALADRLGRNGADFGLAVFTSEGCHICQTLAPALGRTIPILALAPVAGGRAGIRATELMCERPGVYLGLRRGDATALLLVAIALASAPRF